MNILVLCTGNSARSILLEHLLNHAGGETVTAYSAGSQPAGQVHPQALRLLAQERIDTAGARSKSWDEFAVDTAPVMDVVITVCGSAATETCPIWPGAPVRAHWGVEDPAAAPVEDQPRAFADAYAILSRRARALLSLPLHDLGQDGATLQRELIRIGALS
ncbi:arsenate reductase ArsC [Aestuariivita sp.]|jgi:protein-tyrosine-phosphatase|uniref:arsenate reductase ArsC n=1 Tax=Aestuariivita sp. TaxID=1872407 RepID=UPI00216E51FE|nr:arsenate reductase ArsC [Aestuariivita sp.]MCE8005674.1 arsenate reductase ArsC [Aestuariivita sp.]